jgi:hypothetical protein
MAVWLLATRGRQRATLQGQGGPDQIRSPRLREVTQVPDVTQHVRHSPGLEPGLEPPVPGLRPSGVLVGWRDRELCGILGTRKGGREGDPAAYNMRFRARSTEAMPLQGVPPGQGTGVLPLCPSHRGCSPQSQKQPRGDRWAAAGHTVGAW